MQNLTIAGRTVTREQLTVGAQRVLAAGGSRTDAIIAALDATSEAGATGDERRAIREALEVILNDMLGAPPTSDTYRPGAASTPRTIVTDGGNTQVTFHGPVTGSVRFNNGRY